MLAFNQSDSKFKGFILSFQRKPVSAAGCYVHFVPCCSRTICPWVKLVPQMASTSPTDRSPFIFWPIALHEGRLPFIFFVSQLLFHSTDFTREGKPRFPMDGQEKPSCSTVQRLEVARVLWRRECGGCAVRPARPAGGTAVAEGRGGARIAGEVSVQKGKGGWKEGRRDLNASSCGGGSQAALSRD